MSDEPRLECFACMAAVSGEPHVYANGCPACFERSMRAVREAIFSVNVCSCDLPCSVDCRPSYCRFGAGQMVERVSMQQGRA